MSSENSPDGLKIRWTLTDWTVIDAGASPAAAVAAENSARDSASVAFMTPNVRAKRAATAGRQRPDGENVPRTTGRALVACRWRSA